MITCWNGFVFLILCVLFATNDSHFLKKITNKRGCKPAENTFRTLHDLSLYDCALECNIRKKCRAVNYRKELKTCQLLYTTKGTTIPSTTVTRSCDYIKRADILINALKEVCNAKCSLREVCNKVTGICEKKECEMINIMNGVLYGNMVVANSKAKIKCHDGFVPVGNHTRSICSTPSFEWDPPLACIHHVCETLTNPLNGNLSLKNDIEGGTATYTCKSGYTLVGESSATCASNTSSPLCLEDCPGLSDPLQGFVNVTHSYEGGVATYTCRENFTLVGNTSANCASGAWSAAGHTCAKDCPTPPAPINGNVIVTNSYEEGIATYSCNSGYSLVGSNSTRCASGAWNNTKPDCKKECPPLVSPAHGNVDVSHLYEGETAEYKCDHGYKRVGSRKTTCTSSGNWSNVAPGCKKKCQILQQPNNGHVTVTQSYEGGNGTYTCESGYTLNGTSMTFCTSGSWSSAPPICEKDICSTPSAPENGTVSVTGHLVGGTAIFTCNEGYTLEGTGTAHCTAAGPWDPPMVPECKQNCPKLTSPVNGSVVESKSYEGGIATYNCNDGYTLVGIGNATCGSGVWTTAEVPACKQNCPELFNPPNGTVVVTNSYEGGTASYSCNIGHTLVGPGTVNTTCTSGEWDSTVPTCKRDDCLQLMDPLNGHVSVTSYLDQGVATYACDHGYTLDGSSTANCLSPGGWDTLAPDCKKDCPELTSPVNGTVSATTSYEGGIATYMCSDGYTLVGIGSATCGSGVWTPTDVPACKQNCSPPTQPLKGNVSTSPSYEGKNTTYTCFAGFTLVGSETATCESGNWNPAAPICAQNCPALSDLANGTVAAPRNYEEEQAIFSCNPGFTLVGQDTLVCLSGSWNESLPVCKKDDCPALIKPPKVLMVLTKIFINGTANFTCNAGYTLVGENSTICQDNGTWSSAVPICKRDCPSLSLPNGVVNNTNNYEGEIATFICNDGYTLEGPSPQTCDVSGDWNPSYVVPSCKEDCASPPPPANGIVDAPKKYEEGVATYSCNSGFTLVGSAYATCTSGTWSWQLSDNASCVPDVCTTATTPANGNVTVSSNLANGNANFTCFPGYTLVGNDTATCQADGTWNSVAPICLQECESPAAPADGSMSLSTSYEGGIVTYSCNSNFTLVGSAKATCLSGVWNASTPACKRVCEMPPEPSNGQVLASNTYEGENATYTCDSGYTLVGSTTALCESGSWSPNTPLCKKECGNPSAPENGSVSLSTSYEGGTVTYSCNSGFTLVGSAKATCLSGVWNESTPACIIDVCPTLTHPTNGNVSVTHNLANGVATFTCASGYILVGSNTVTCVSLTGNWSAEAPVCKQDCGNPNIPSNGSVAFNYSYEGGVALYSCMANYTLVGSNTSICEPGLNSGEWSSAEPTCKQDCPVILTPINGNTSVTFNYEGGVATYACYDGYTLIGETTATCELGYWSIAAPTCKQDCPALSKPENGEKEVSNTYEGGTVTYTCNFGYSLVGYSSATCTEGSWTVPTPSCAQDPATDCLDVLRYGYGSNTGKYTILLPVSGQSKEVYCDMDTDEGGWTVFQNRYDGAVDFNQSFSEYVDGFGNIEGEFWLGLESIREMTSGNTSKLQIKLTAADDTTKNLTYDSFSVSSSPQYTLQLGTLDLSQSFEEPIEQWVKSVKSFSSQYSNGPWSAMQIIGEPDVYPEYGDKNKAWAPDSSDDTFIDFIEVEFEEAVLVTNISVYETYYAGSVIEISALLKNYSTNIFYWHRLFTSDGIEDFDNSRIFSPQLETIHYETNTIRITCDCTEDSNYVEIDAIKLVGKRVIRDLNTNNGTDFTTNDHDMDKSPDNCATKNHGPWWYRYCETGVNLNGEYAIPGTQSLYNDGQGGVIFETFKGKESLKKTKMMFKKDV